MKMRTFAARMLPSAGFVLLAVATGSAHSKPSSSPPLSEVPLPSEGQLAQVPIGLVPGGAESEVASHISNPTPTIEHGASAVEEGRQLFVKLNCADCHGFTAKGLIGPNLTNGDWRYGGTPAAIYKSIFEGRAEGMPAWGAVLPEKDIWALVAYLQSLGGTYPPSSYQPSLQGDKKGELVAPEIGFLQANDGSPPYQVPKDESGDSGSTQGKAANSGGSGTSTSRGEPILQSESQGKRVFVDAGCAVCHGLVGGGGVGPKLREDQFLAKKDRVVDRIRNGGGPMPGFADKLTDAQIAAVASYIRESWGNHYGKIVAKDVK